MKVKHRVSERAFQMRTSSNPGSWRNRQRSIKNRRVRPYSLSGVTGNGTAVRNIMTPNKFTIDAFCDDGKLTLFPILQGRTEVHIIYTLPSFEISVGCAEGIGEKILDIASYIRQLEIGEKTVKKASDRDILSAIGYSSWARVKNSTKMLKLRYTESDGSKNVLTVTPLYPVGRGYQYIQKENKKEYADINNAFEVGQAVLIALELF